ncbi:hypothetical protein V5799_000630 [Amblyomma americanum]|uniref:Uncharacterized protein n=1 Tax=Amblyomma americanum TaxID=6943 RepID=A0AAQ4D2H7_AMBAM
MSEAAALAARTFQVTVVLYDGRGCASDNTRAMFAPLALARAAPPPLPASRRADDYYDDEEAAAAVAEELCAQTRPPGGCGFTAVSSDGTPFVCRSERDYRLYLTLLAECAFARFSSPVLFSSEALVRRAAGMALGNQRLWDLEMTTASPEEIRGDSVKLLRLQRSTRLCGPVCRPLTEPEWTRSDDAASALRENPCARLGPVVSGNAALEALNFRAETLYHAAAEFVGRHSHSLQAARGRIREWVLAFGAASPAGKSLRNVLVVARAQCESDNHDFRRQVQVALQERAAVIADHGLVPLESWRWRRPKRRRRKNKKRKAAVAAVVVAGAATAGVPLRQRQQLNLTKGDIGEEEEEEKDEEEEEDEDEGYMAKEEQDEYDRSSQTEVFTLSAKTLCRRYLSYAKYLLSEWNRMGRQRPTKQHGGS